VLDVYGKYSFGCRSAIPVLIRSPVPGIPFGRSDQLSAEAFVFGCPPGVRRTTRIPSSVEDVVAGRVNLAFAGHGAAAGNRRLFAHVSSVARGLFCRPSSRSGFAVTPASHPRRRSSSIMNRK